MMQKIKDFFLRHEWVTIALIGMIFLAIRIPGTDLPLHQDEYKWPMIVKPGSTAVSIPHPPLSQFIYRTGGYIVGFNTNFRFIPLFFGTLNLFLLYYFLRFAYGKRQAVIGSLIWTFSYFSVLASLMVDTDGEIMPFFFLVALIAYYKIKNKPSYVWKIVLGLSLLAGLFIKVSFILTVGAIVCDFLWERKDRLSLRQYLLYAGYGVGGVVTVIALLFISQYIFPFFSISQSATYWEHFFIWDRNFFQTAIQCFKALLYTSPLLVLLPFFDIKKTFSETRVFVFFLLFSFLFYIVLFDFSIGALDRYLQLLILPLSVMCAVQLGSIDIDKKRVQRATLFGLVVAIILFALQFVYHTVPSLHPKIEWVGRITSFHWNFLYPFSGGSGPLGFYISFLFIALSWIISVLGLTVYMFKQDKKYVIMLFLIPIGFVYNAVFTVEYITGYFNGSSSRLLSDVVVYIKNNPDIHFVTVYNDNGGNEIQEIGKYRKRLYTDPVFDVNEKIKTLNTYKEHYLEIDIPKIDKKSVYRKYLDSCKIVYNEQDKKISAIVYDCRKAPDVSL